MNASNRVCLGVIVGVKGLRGEVRIKSFTEDPADVAAYGPVTTADGRSFKLQVVGAAQGVVIARINGVADRTAAEGLKGLELFVDRAALPPPEEGTFYHADLLGADVTLSTGEHVGKVSAFFNFGGGDLMEVTGAGKDTVLVPLTADAIAAMDVNGKHVTVHPLPGLFGGESDEEDAENQGGGRGDQG